MSLDMYGLIDPGIESTPSGGVTLLIPQPGGYTGPGGSWVEPAAVEQTLTLVTIQSASLKTAEFFSGQGGTANPSDMRVLYINDGTMIYPGDDGTFAHTLKFSDGIAEREWRVIDSDPRPWHSYCKAIVKRYRGGE